MFKHILESLEYNLLSFNNNSLLLRYILSISVFYSHMFAIYGLPEPSLLFGNHSLGWYAVDGFFFISGILVTQSYLSRGMKLYMVARLLRVMPAYVLALVISVLVVMLFDNIIINIGFFTQGARAIFVNLLPLQYVGPVISGAWSKSSIPSLNDSLWTIPFEVFCYIIIIPLILVKQRKIFKIILIMVGIYFIYRLGIIDGSIRFDMSRTIIYFAIGSSLYMIIKMKKINIYFIISFLSLFIFEGNIREVLMGYLIILFILYFTFYFKSLTKLKIDCSYGIYLYAWPISQVMKGGLGIENIYFALLLGGIILFILSYVSWTYVEKPILRFKNKHTKINLM